MHRTIKGSAAGLALAAVLALFPRSSRADDDGLPLPPIRKPSAAAPPAPTDVTPSFDPATDAPLFQNNGDYASPLGDCFGMSLVAIDNFLRRVKTGVPTTPPPGKVSELAADGDLKEEEVAALLEADAYKKDEKRSATPNRPTNPQPILDALARIQKTGTPEPFFTFGGKNNPMGHVTVLFGSKDGKLLFYDPDFPGETLEWPFDPKKGLGAHPKSTDKELGDFYGHIQSFGVAPFDSLQASKDIGAIRQAVAAEESGSTKDFPKVGVKLSPGAKDDEVELTGTVSRGLKAVNGEPTTPASRVWIKINGTPVPQPASLARDGSFKVTLPRSRFTSTSDVVVVATTRAMGPSPDEQGSLAGFSTQRLDLPAVRTGFVQGLEKASGK